MDPILIVNAGSSSVKFEVVAVGGSADLNFQIRGAGGRHRYTVADARPRRRWSAAC